MNLTNVEYTPKEMNIIVFENFLKMLKRRDLITNIEQLFEDQKNDIVPNKSLSVTSGP